MVDYAYPLEAGRQGWEDSQNRLNQFAQQRAGNMLASGDVQGGVNALYRAGDLQNGFALQQHQEQLAQKQRENAIADRKEQLDFTRQAIHGVSRVLQAGGDPVAAFDHVAPVYLAMEPDPARRGEVQQRLGQIREALATDPAGTLAALGDATEKEWQIMARRDGSVVAVNKSSLEKKDLYPALPQAAQGGQHLPQGMVMDEDGNVSFAPGFIEARAALAKATRAPPRARSSGGGRGGGGGFPGLPPGYRPK